MPLAAKCMMSRSSATFTSLAVDLVLRVFQFLQPSDIISLRKTCKTLSELTKLRTVWISALRSVMIKHCVSEATCPFQEMTLPLLEHVALAPHRLTSLVARSDGATVLPMTIRVLSPRLTNAEKEMYGIQDNDGLYDSCVEPSGRFLASLSAYESFTLFTVWDLGLCGNDVIRPIARYLEEAPVTLFLDGFNPGPQKSGAFYLVSANESSFLNPLSVLVHKVSMSAPVVMTFSAKLEIPIAAPFIMPHTHQVPGTCNLVAQYDDDDGVINLWVWNFLANTAAAMAIIDHQSTGKETIQYYNDCIMIASDGCIRIYNLPPLLPRHSIVVPAERKATIVIATPSMTFRSFFRGQDVAQNMPSYFAEITQSQVTIFEVAENNQFHNSNLPNKLPIAVGRIRLTDQVFWSQNQRFTNLRQCEDVLLLMGYSNADSESGDLSVFGADTDGIFGKGGGKLMKTIFANALVRQDVKGKQLCPTLGRVYIHTRRRAAPSRRGHCIYIFDYLAPPRNK
ncbi:hypothetical protein CVT26_004861 [Gymnopilus dilepis]|uniref:F-box domain-containing protein n=1 Tax=Gymnopilus dilepis TaxID=231916 RepID=A0A409X6H8_9AGAR|nr:hypothetical protein CVT26_004861 [Gymnopilus dilepis]